VIQACIGLNYRMLSFLEEEKTNSPLKNLYAILLAGEKNNLLKLSPTEIKNKVMPMTLTFLRRTIIFLHTLGIYPSFSASLVLELPTDFDALCKLLHLPTDLDLLFTDNEPLVDLAKKWCNTTVAKISTFNPMALAATEPDMLRFVIPWLGEPKPTKLMDLPSTFQELVLKFMGVKCTTCQTVPKQGGLCLLCGMLVCVASQCCSKNETGECARHLLTCPGGVFLILKSTYVLIVRDEKRIVHGSLYLDDHGEEDPNMRRGKTLYLNTARYEELTKLWVTQSFDHDSKCIAATVNDGHLM